MGQEHAKEGLVVGGLAKQLQPGGAAIQRVIDEAARYVACRTWHLFTQAVFEQLAAEKAAEAPWKKEIVNLPPKSGKAWTVPASVAKLIQQGGKFWSSPSKASRGDTSFSPGDRFWVWPVEDRVFEVKDGKLPIKFHWQVRPGQKPPQEKNIPSGPSENDPVVAQFDFLSKEGGATNFNSHSHRLQLETGASEGIFEVTFNLKDFSGVGDVGFFLKGDSIFPKKADSNLLGLKVKFAK